MQPVKGPEGWMHRICSWILFFLELGLGLLALNWFVVYLADRPFSEVFNKANDPAGRMAGHEQAPDWLMQQIDNMEEIGVTRAAGIPVEQLLVIRDALQVLGIEQTPGFYQWTRESFRHGRTAAAWGPRGGGGYGPPQTCDAGGYDGQLDPHLNKTSRTR